MTRVLPGDIACVPVAGPIGWGIGLGEVIAGAPFTGHRLPAYDHTLMYAGEFTSSPRTRFTHPDSKGRYGAGHYVFEAHPDGARFRKLDWPPGQYPRALWSSGLIPLSASQRSMSQDLMHELAGTGYSALDYVAIGARRAGLGTASLQRYIESTGHMICSQLADYVHLRVGSHLFSDGRWCGYVDPWDIARLLLGLQVNPR